MEGCGEVDSVCGLLLTMLVADCSELALPLLSLLPDSAACAAATRADMTAAAALLATSGEGCATGNAGRMGLAAAAAAAERVCDMTQL